MIRNCSKNENGAALIIAVLMLVLLSLIGLSAIGTTIYETNISGNERTGADAFYAAEAGLHGGIDQLPLTTPISRTKVGEESYYWSGSALDRTTPRSLSSFGLHQKAGYDTSWGFKRYQVNATGESLNSLREVEAQVSLGPYPSGTHYNN